LDNPCNLKEKIDPVRSPDLYRMLQEWRFEDHSKLPYLTDLVNSFIVRQGKKLIIWSGRPSTLNALAGYFAEYNPQIIHGEIKTPAGKSRNQHKFDLLEEFKTHDDRPLLLASYLVLKQSVDILESTRSVYFDRSWKYIDWAQSRKRSQRIGQTEDVLISYLIFQNTIEMRQDRRLSDHKKMNTDLFRADSIPASEWKRIFEGETLYE